jgi:hypothetical protein
MMLVHHNGHETEEWIEEFPVNELYHGCHVRLTIRGGVWPAVIDTADRDFVVTQAEGSRRGVRFEAADVEKIELGW